MPGAIRFRGPQYVRPPNGMESCEFDPSHHLFHADETKENDEEMERRHEPQSRRPQTRRRGSTQLFSATQVTDAEPVVYAADVKTIEQQQRWRNYVTMAGIFLLNHVQQ